MRFSICQIVIGREKKGYRRQKNDLFNILSLANQLHRLKSTYLKDLKSRKIYFLENQIPDLRKQGPEYLAQAIKSYKETIKKGLAH